MALGRALVAGSWAAALSGAPSTLHALATGRDPLEATLAAGSLLLPRETRRARLVAAAVPVHVALSLAWAVVLDRARVRGALEGAVAGLAIGVVDLGLGRELSPRIRWLPLAPQLADHVAYGAVAGRLLARPSEISAPVSGKRDLDPTTGKGFDMDDRYESTTGSTSTTPGGTATTDMWAYHSQPGIVGADLVGFSVEATDGGIGKIDEASEEAGRNLLVVDTGPWIFGKKVMIPAGIVDRVDLDGETVYVNRTKDEVKNAPEFDRDTHFADEAYHDRLGTYYGGSGSPRSDV